MSRATQDRLIAHVLDTIERERDLLLAGDYGALAEQAEAREASLERLRMLSPLPAPELVTAIETMRDALTRNERLLAAALEGVAAGRQRVDEIERAGRELQSYDASGAPVDRGTVSLSGRRA